jgi:hypothetical protein
MIRTTSIGVLNHAVQSMISRRASASEIFPSSPEKIHSQQARRATGLALLGLVSGYTIGAFIHVLLVVAIVLFLVGLISGRRVL